MVKIHTCIDKNRYKLKKQSPHRKGLFVFFICVTIEEKLI